MPWLLLAFILCPAAHALSVLNLNVFDQQQGHWPDGFRAQRLATFGAYVKETRPDVVTLQEVRAGERGADSADVASFREAYPYRRYLPEAPGPDGATYGYWIGAKQRPRAWLEESFSFPGGVPRRVQGAVWSEGGKGCLGVLSLHLSYQSSAVRQREARWLLTWIKDHERLCRRWLVLGDFNADEHDPELGILFGAGLRSLYRDAKPTVGAFNPIRRVYGENLRAQTIDWALGWNLAGEASVVLDTAQDKQWVSDHAAVRVTVP